MAFRVKAFWVQETGRHTSTLRASAEGPCPAHGERHRAEVTIEVVGDDFFPEDKYPKACSCGHAFTEHDWSGSGRPVYRRLDNGEEIRGALPPGALLAMKPAAHSDGWSGAGADGKSVVCVTPGGWWYIDSRASNCTLKSDIVHRCWVRHGTVGGQLHVDKNGNTCAAGAGSIVCGDFHGFLHNGELYQC